MKNSIISILSMLTMNMVCQLNFDPQDTLNKLTLDQKIGQLFIAPCIIDQKENAVLVAAKNYPTDVSTVKKLIEAQHVGGIVYLGLGTPEQQMETTEEFKKLTHTPLLFVQDFERGLPQRLYNTLRLPFNMTLGALENENLLYEMGAEIARQCKILGVHINLAPVCDANNNPNNPIINDRSFGEDPRNVARKAIAFMRGLQDNGILACAKHFPGHGDVTKDSHEELPKVPHNRERLNAIELYPFQEIINAGIMMVMSAFLEVPALEIQEHRPAALSHAIVTKLLKEELGFSGIVITDGLDMKGVTQFGTNADIALHALQAGNDLLLCSKDIPASIAKIKEAIENGIFSLDELNARVAKILRAKQWAFAQHKKNNDYGNLKKLFMPEALKLKQRLFSQSITLAHDTHHEIPINTDQPLALITFSEEKAQSIFAQTLQTHVPTKEFIAHPNVSSDDINAIIKELHNFDTIIVSLLHMTRLSSIHFDAKTNEKKVVNDFGITKETLALLDALRKTNKKIILVVFGNPYSLKLLSEQNTIIIAYENDEDSQRAAADVVTGNLPARGKLPVS